MYFLSLHFVLFFLSQVFSCHLKDTTVLRTEMIIKQNSRLLSNSYCARLRAAFWCVFSSSPPTTPFLKVLELLSLCLLPRCY